MKKHIYCDYAATTPVAPEVMAAMRPYFSHHFGNPGSLHVFGQYASRAVFLSREQIAHALGCNYKEIIFTGSATEANNMALRGIARMSLRSASRRRSNPNAREIASTDYFQSRNDGMGKPRIIISAIEHASVLETARDLERDGVEVIYVPVTRDGIVDLAKLCAALNDRTVLVSIMYANNEIGTIQPIREISEMIREFRSRHCDPLASGEAILSEKRLPRRELAPRNDGGVYPLFHVDAVQAFQYLPCRVDDLGVDLMTLSAHKIYGPKGIGLLYIKDQNSKIKMTSQNFKVIEPIITGGYQERGLRAGTENVPYIVGFAKAIEFVEKLRVKESARILKLRDYFWSKLQQIFPQVQLNGSPTCLPAGRIPNNLNIYFPGFSANELLIALDFAGIVASSGSACQAYVADESYVIKALGGAKERASSSVRFTLGRGTTKKEIESILKAIKEIYFQSKVTGRP